MAAAGNCYTDEEIVNFLSSCFEMKVTIHDLRQLKPDFVQKMYCNFLLDFGASLDQINQFPFDVCDLVRQHPHVYSSVGRWMILAKVINAFLKCINKDLEFMPADLFDPKAKRTRRFFTILIDFYYCAKENLETLVTIEEKAKIKLESKEELLEHNNEREERIRQLKLESEENQIREEQMLKRIADVKSEIQEAQGSKVNLKGQFDQIKVDITSYVTHIKAVELEILEKKERIEILESQVVQASECQEIEERECRLAMHRNDNAVRSENLAVLKQTLQVTKSAIDLITDELMPVLQEIQQALDNAKEQKTAISQHERLKRSCLEEAEDHDMKIQQIKEILLSRQEKVSQMRIAWKLKKDILQGEIDQSKALIAEVWRNQTEDEIVSQDLQKERLKILREIQQFKEQISEFDVFVASNYHKILQAVERHNSEIQESLGYLVQGTIVNHSES